jgi:hypothetical protein
MLAIGETTMIYDVRCPRVAVETAFELRKDEDDGTRKRMSLILYTLLQYYFTHHTGLYVCYVRTILYTYIHTFYTYVNIDRIRPRADRELHGSW